MGEVTGTRLVGIVSTVDVVRFSVSDDPSSAK
jgi:hypothetical protein